MSDKIHVVKPKFKHTVVKVTLSGEEEIAYFYVNNPFGEIAMYEFKRLSRIWGGHNIVAVPDQTLAGLHYVVDADVYELR